MYKILDDNYTSKHDSWLTCDLGFLRKKLKEEVKEYFEAANDTERMKEVLDIANICLFLYIRCMLTSAQARLDNHLKEIKRGL
jgi:predicted house-cleaning noncanonical NTP pyrophosphatase (MazG superfamily)